MQTTRKALLAMTVVTSLLALAGQAGAATPGTLNGGFGSGGVAGSGSSTRFFGTTVQPDGKTVAVGETGVGSSVRLLVERFGISGALDGSFGSGGTVTGPSVTGGPGGGSVGRAVAVQSDGKIVVVGKATDASTGQSADGLLIERYTSGGALDKSFGGSGVVTFLTGLSQGDGYAIALQPDGKIIASGSTVAAGSGGTTPRVTVARVNTNGSADTSFGSGGVSVLDLGAYSVARAVALQSDGRIVVAGSQSPSGQAVNALVARLTSAGALDSSFHPFAAQLARNGAASSAFNAVAVQSDGKIVAAGAATDGSEGADAIVARLGTTGSLDATFGSGGVTVVPSASSMFQTSTSTVPGANGLTIAPNGDLIAAGVTAVQLETSAAVWAFKSNGSLDSSFGTGGVGAPINAGAGNVSELAGAALSPTTGDISVVGDAGAALGRSYSGLVAQYIGFGPPAPSPSGLKVSLSGLKGSYTLNSVLKSGIKVKAGCTAACTLKATLGISASVARRLGLPTKTKRQCKKVKGKKRCTTTRVYASHTVTTSKSTFKSASSKTVTLRINGAFAKALHKLESSIATARKRRQTKRLKQLTKGVSVNIGVAATSTGSSKAASSTKHTTLKP